MLPQAIGDLRQARFVARWGMLSVIFNGCVVLVGALLTVRAKQLSLRYNAWTTSFREKNPHINPPPTPEMRELNTKRMTRIIRIAGVFVTLLSLFMLFDSFLLLQSSH